MTRAGKEVISIVTIVKNDAEGLNRTVDSVLSQGFADWELLIVVGESTDSTLSIAKSLAIIDNRVRVLSQEGFGIYAAMNMGLKEARAQFICFMNAGDEFWNSSVLASAIREISSNSVGLVIGGYQVDQHGRDEKFSFSRKLISELDFAFNRKGGCHQAMVFRKDALVETGGFSLHYKLASDFESVLQVIRHSGALRVSEFYARIEAGGAADIGIFRVHREKHEIRKNFFSKKTITILSFIWTVAAGLKVALRRLILIGRTNS